MSDDITHPNYARSKRSGWLAVALGSGTLAFLTSQAIAETLVVGPGKPFSSPSAAIAAAHVGDTIHISAGTYYDCATIGRDRVIVEGAGPQTILTDKTCGGKALLIVDASDVTVRDLTLQRARVPDGNGAGIRAEGGSLTVDNVRFINDQDGILTADNRAATLRITNSVFEQDGVCLSGGGCAHAVYTGNLGLLHVERSRFFDTRDGHDIKSRALRTEIVDNTIEDGPDGTSSYLVDVPNGGALVLTGNTMEKGPNCTNHGAAVSIGEEGVDRPTDEIVVRHNVFHDDMGRQTTFIRNVTATPVQLVGNTLVGQVRPLEGDGSRL